MPPRLSLRVLRCPPRGPLRLRSGKASPVAPAGEEDRALRSFFPRQSLHLPPGEVASKALTGKVRGAVGLAPSPAGGRLGWGLARAGRACHFTWSCT